MSKQIKKKWIVASFYTEGTPYQEEAGKLLKSCRNYGIPNYIASMPNLKNWQKNHHMKPNFILHTMMELKDFDIVWTDADSIFYRYPDLFDQYADKGIEFACHFRNWRYNKRELLSGTMYLKNCELIHELLKRWNRFNKKFPNEWGQKNLEKTLHKYGHLLKSAKLPVEYCAIFDDENIKKINPVIKHFQCSRKYRNRVRHV